MGADAGKRVEEPEGVGPEERPSEEQPADAIAIGPAIGSVGQSPGAGPTGIVGSGLAGAASIAPAHADQPGTDERATVEGEPGSDEAGGDRSTT